MHVSPMVALICDSKRTHGVLYTNADIHTQIADAVSNDNWLPPDNASLPNNEIVIANKPTKAIMGRKEINGCGIIVSLSSVMFYCVV